MKMAWSNLGAALSLAVALSTLSYIASLKATSCACALETWHLGFVKFGTMAEVVFMSVVLIAAGILGRATLTSDGTASLVGGASAAVMLLSMVSGVAYLAWWRRTRKGCECTEDVRRTIALAASVFAFVKLWIVLSALTMIIFALALLPQRISPRST